MLLRRQCLCCYPKAVLATCDHRRRRHAQRRFLCNVSSLFWKRRDNWVKRGGVNFGRGVIIGLSEGGPTILAATKPMSYHFPIGTANTFSLPRTSVSAVPCARALLFVMCSVQSVLFANCVGSRNKTTKPTPPTTKQQVTEQPPYTQPCARMHLM